MNNTANIIVALVIGTAIGFFIGNHVMIKCGKFFIDFCTIVVS